MRIPALPRTAPHGSDLRRNIRRACGTARPIGTLRVSLLQDVGLRRRCSFSLSPFPFGLRPRGRPWPCRGRRRDRSARLECGVRRFRGRGLAGRYAHPGASGIASWPPRGGGRGIRATASAMPDRRDAGRAGFRCAPGRRAVLVPSPTVPSDRHECRAAACDDGAVAAAGIGGAIRGHGADALVLGDLARGIWPDRSGGTGLSIARQGIASAMSREGLPGRGVTPTARMSEVAVSVAGCPLRHWRRPGTPCLRARHPPSPGHAMPVPSTRRSGGQAARRWGICVSRVFRPRHGVEHAATGRSGPAGHRRLATAPAVCPSGSLD